MVSIIDKGLSFGSLSQRGSTTRIIVHHAEASSASVEDIHSWHKGNGWSGIGYHFYIRKDGSVYRGRPEWAVGSHCAGSNFDSIGVCFEGNYNNETMPDAQLQAGRELLAQIKAKYGISKVIKHRDVYSTDCPGNAFPWEELMLEGQWKQDSVGWWYRFSDGTYPKSKWLQLDAWYYFNEMGYAVTGWQKINGKWYWFDENCRMAESTCMKIKGKWYAFSSSGAMFAGSIPASSDGDIIF